MKRYSLLIPFTLLLLAGCGSKSHVSLTFDEFTMKLYDNGKQYVSDTVDTSIEGMTVLKQMKEYALTGSTGFINSFVIFRVPIHSWTDMEELAESNMKSLQLKLLKFSAIDNESKKVKCDDLQYSWYITAFSYQLEKKAVYGGQYFFADDESLYLLSLSSDQQKDIQSFIRSAKTVKCK